MSDSEIRTYLQSHPKTLSALFGLMVLLSSVSPAAAAFGVCRGP